MTPIRVEIYSRPGCHLCDEAKEVIEGARASGNLPPFELTEIDIETAPALEQRFGQEIPVVFIAGRKAFKFHVDEQDFRAKLSRAVVSEPS